MSRELRYVWILSSKFAKKKINKTRRSKELNKEIILLYTNIAYLHLNIVGIVYISSIDGRPRCKDRFLFHALFHVLYDGMGDIRISNIRDTINNK